MAFWQRLREALNGAVAELDMATKVSADGQGRLVISFPESQKFNRDRCQRPANLSRIEAAMLALLQRVKPGAHVGAASH